MQQNKPRSSSSSGHAKCLRGAPLPVQQMEIKWRQISLITVCGPGERHLWWVKRLIRWDNRSDRGVLSNFRSSILILRLFWNFSEVSHTELQKGYGLSWVLYLKMQILRCFIEAFLCGMPSAFCVPPPQTFGMGPVSAHQTWAAMRGGIMMMIPSALLPLLLQ